MKTLRWMWMLGAAILVLVALSEMVSSAQKTEPLREDDQMTITEQREYNRIADELGTDMCFIIPAFVLCCVMAWRNSLGLRKERQHREMVDAISGRMPEVEKGKR